VHGKLFEPLESRVVIGFWPSSVLTPPVIRQQMVQNVVHGNNTKHVAIGVNHRKGHQVIGGKVTVNLRDRGINVDWFLL
jgi:hypothetical protein